MKQALVLKFSVFILAVLIGKDALFGQVLTCDSQTLLLYHFDKASGDSPTNACTGLAGGIATGTSIVTGKYGKARSFNGSSDYIGISNAQGSGNNITIEAWVYVTGYASGVNDVKHIYMRRGNNADHKLGIKGPEGKLYFELGDGGFKFGAISVESSFPVNLNVWTHVAGTYDGSTMKVFMNGNQVKANTVPTNVSWSGLKGTDVGRDPDGQPARYFKGYVDELRISKIARIYEGSTCDNNTLLLYYFDETTGDSPRDACTGQPDGIATGTNIVDGKYGKARSFNGVGDYIGISSAQGSGNNISIEAWVYVTGYASGINDVKHIYMRRGNNADHKLGIKGSEGKLYFELGDGGFKFGAIWVESNSPVSKNVWTHVAGTYDGSSMKLYIEGKEAGSNTVSTNVSWSGLKGTDVGRDPDGQPERYFKGYIDALKVSKIAVVPIPSIGFTRITNRLAGASIEISPNPFNKIAEITFSLKSKNASRLYIRDIKGKKIKYFPEMRTMGNAKKIVWNGTDEAGSKLSPGIYLFTIQTENNHETKKLFLIR